MKALTLIMIFFNFHTAQAGLRNAPQSIWDRLPSQFTADKELAIEQKDGHFVLHGSASEKTKVLNELSLWSKKKAQGEVDMNQSIIVDDLIPEKILKDKWSRHMLNGANCHNNSLLTLGLMNKRMFVGFQEIDKHLQLYCKVLEGPQIGALGVQRTSAGVAIHSYVVAGDKLVYQKANVSAKIGPSFGKFFDSWKSKDEFYDCRANEELPKTCSPMTKKLVKEIESLHHKTSMMLTSLTDAANLKSFIQEAQDLEANLFRDHSCPEYQELLQARIQSVLSLYNDLEITGGIYGKGSYDSSGPRI